MTVKDGLARNTSSYLYSGLILYVLIAFGVFIITENSLLFVGMLTPFVLFTLLLDYRILLYGLVLTLPFSVELRLDQLNLTIGLPTEPIIGLLSIATLVLVFLHKGDKGIFKATFVRLMLIYWLFLGLSVVFSSMPMVSLKAYLVASGYLAVFYFLMVFFMYPSSSRIWRIFFLYACSLALIVSWASYNHYDYGFNKMYSAHVVEPFFGDHTIYGACLAFLVPISAVLYWKADVFKLSWFQKNLTGLFSILFLAGIFLSHSRATWLSLLSIPVVLLILYVKLSFKYLMVIIGTVLFLVIVNSEVLMPVLLKNKNDSKAKRANLEEQIKSVTNVKNDVSNAERVNRWLCAYRMSKEKPLTGFGIGTFQFKYIPFQKGKEMTEISVTTAKNNYAQGMGGSAHSEYLLVIAESGIFAGAALLILFGYALFLGMSLYYGTQGEDKYTALMVLLALITYFVHGVFNNFLTTDKAAFLVWTALAGLTALDVKQRQQKKLL